MRAPKPACSESVSRFYDLVVVRRPRSGAEEGEWMRAVAGYPRWEQGGVLFDGGPTHHDPALALQPGVGPEVRPLTPGNTEAHAGRQACALDEHLGGQGLGETGGMGYVAARRLHGPGN